MWCVQLPVRNNRVERLLFSFPPRTWATFWEAATYSKIAIYRILRDSKITVSMSIELSICLASPCRKIQICSPKMFTGGDEKYCMLQSCAVEFEFASRFSIQWRCVNSYRAQFILRSVLKTILSVLRITQHILSEQDCSPSLCGITGPKAPLWYLIFCANPTRGATCRDGSDKCIIF